MEHDLSNVLASVASRSGVAASPRRRHVRIDSLGRCFAELGGGWEGSVLNVSLSGMLLRLRRLLTPGSSYFVKLFLADAVAVVEARVVRLDGDGNEGECLAGMEFLSMSAVDQAVLRRYVHR